MESRLDGVLGVAVKDLSTGRTITHLPRANGSWDAVVVGSEPSSSEPMTNAEWDEYSEAIKVRSVVAAGSARDLRHKASREAFRNR